MSMDAPRSGGSGGGYRGERPPRRSRDDVEAGDEE